MVVFSNRGQANQERQVLPFAAVRRVRITAVAIPSIPLLGVATLMSSGFSAFAVLLPVCIATTLIVGCGGSDASLAPASGVVMLDGKPLTSGTLITTVDGGRGARGVINSNGEYKLETPDVGEGAIPGTHYVAVIAYEQADPNNLESAQRPLVPTKYLSAYNSGLIIQVRQGEENTSRLELRSR